MLSPSPVTPDIGALARSFSQWWALAGVDTAIDEVPRGWLGRERRAAPAAPVPTSPEIAEAALVAAPPPAAIPAPVDAAMPDRLDDFLAWLAKGENQPETAFSTDLADRVLPRAVPQAEMLIVTDMPSVADMAAGRLFAGEEAALIAAMLRAMGIAEDRVAFASLLLARPVGGVIDDKVATRATTRLRHFADLLQPQGMMLFGDQTSRALEPTNRVETDASSPAINLASGTIPVMYLPAPFILLKHSERKAAAWVQLRRIAARR